MKAINNNIKHLREYHGLTQAEFASVVGTTPQHISMIEKGSRSPSIDLFKRICEEFHITPNRLSREDD